MTSYSVVVVARNHAKQLLASLLAVKRYAPEAEVIVVDNASSASLVGSAKLSQLAVRMLKLDEHASLGAAFNAGLDAATHDLVLLLHVDSMLLAEPTPAIELMQAQQDIGVVGGKLMSGGEQPWRIRHAGYELGRGQVGVRHRGRGEWDTFRDGTDVDAVSDACLLVRRSDVRFDERYWFRLQDVDLCLQYRQRGQRVVLLPDLIAVHTETGGVADAATDPTWASRQLAGQWLFHERWACKTPLVRLKPRTAVRGPEAVDYLERSDTRYGLKGKAA